ncbi:stage V sporulation protein AD [Shouchella shacheensis]|uniref:stage V sporulation protein AD n=1 Tax=Shouchella shacheensis TaxID=1649580 RepID=UPI00073FBC26|nr:stage V sporulation protein AD [Shouchella shacheensis]
MKRLGRQTYVFKSGVYVEATGTAVGPREGEGPLRESFDYAFSRMDCGEKSWEQAERTLMQKAIDTCLEKKSLTPDRVNLLIAGDLSNQTVTSSFVARDLGIPYLGSYSACATSMESVAIASIFIDGGFTRRVMAAASSHYGAAEKQFRYPTEFAVQKPDSAQTTVTAAGAILLHNKKTKIRVCEATIGAVQDLGVGNPLDLGSAMAPAAAETTLAHLAETKRSISDYDLVVTGDLARVGSEIFRKLLREKGIVVTHTYEDCGVMIYNTDPSLYAGGSGAGCSSAVVFGHVLQEIQSGRLKRVLVVATGALLSPLMIQQKQSIPAIAHAVTFEAEDA